MLNLIEKDLTNVKEELHNLYVKTADGSFKLNVKGLDKSTVFEDIEALKEAIRKEREETAKEREFIKKIKGDLEQASDKIAGLEKSGGLTNEDAVKLANLERVNAELTEKLSTSTGELDALHSKILFSEKSAQISKLLQERVVPEAIEDLISLYADKIDVIDGKLLTNKETGLKVGLDAGAFFDELLESKSYLKKQSVSSSRFPADPKINEKQTQNRFVTEMKFGDE